MGMLVKLGMRLAMEAVGSTVARDAGRLVESGRTAEACSSAEDIVVSLESFELRRPRMAVVVDLAEDSCLGRTLANL